MLPHLACSCYSSMHRKRNILLLFTILCITHFLAGGAVQLQHHHGGRCIPAERDALLSFKNSITVDSANLLNSWHVSQDCCRWRGVCCSNRTGRVIKLQLRNPNPAVVIAGKVGNTADGCHAGNALFGEISPSLLSLKHLEHMDLSMNCLPGPNGSFPEFLGSMENLRYLNLSGIPFMGRVPPQLGNLSKLQYLDLDQNNYWMHSTDITWLTNLPLLRYLSMSRVNLSQIADWSYKLNMIPSLRVLRLSLCSLHSANQSLPYFNLTKLEKLDLSGNYFGHSIESSWFWRATSLKYLNLLANRLYGQLGNLKNFCSLEGLELSNNFIDGDIAVFMEGLRQCGWTNLQQLDVSYNSFTGTLPNWIGKFTNLRTLDIYSNQLTGRVPTEIGSLKNLIVLDLAYNRLSGVIREEHFAGLKRLKGIDLSFNDLEIVSDPDWRPPFRLESAKFASCQMGPLIPVWLQWQEITELDISGNALKGELPDWFWSAFSHAKYLDISNNQISGSLPSHLDGMDLEELHLRSNRLTGPIPTLPTNITVLDISNNTFSGTLPSNFEASRLQRLLIYSNRIGGYIPESICKLQELLYLDFSNNILEDEIPECFDIHKIQFFLVSNNSLSGKFPGFLQNNKGLKFLDLAWNKFSGRLPRCLGELGHLNFLLLSHNTFSGNIPVDITNLVHLQYLDLSSNNFSGALPWHFSNLTSMINLQQNFMPMFDIYIYTKPEIIIGAGQLGEIFSVITKGQQLIYGRTLTYFVSIDLSDNSLTGEIPTDITSLVALLNLNLSSNQLRGQIPTMIGAMESLVSLDLSKNNLSGEIPSSMSSLTSLSYLNLSCNNLSGRIPSGRQLDTLSEKNQSLMYIGNTGLCGPPLKKNCSGNDSQVESRKQEFEPMTFYFGLVLGLVAGLWFRPRYYLFRIAIELYNLDGR